MFSRMKRQARKYYSAQADLLYIDSLFENNANSDKPVDADEHGWMVQAGKANARMNAATENIVSMGGLLKNGNVYDAQGQPIRSHMYLAV